MAHNFQRPNLRYDAESLNNDKRYRLLTRSNKRPPTDSMLDTDINYLIDAVRQLDKDIENVEAGAIPGSDDPENASSLVTTDGDGNIGWVKIQDSNIADHSISNLKIIPQTITADEIQDGTVTSDKIAANAVTTSKITDEAVTTGKIAANAVTEAKIAANAVTTPKITDDAITTGKIAANAVTAAKIAANAVTTPKITDDAITTGKIAANAVTAAKIANQTITAMQIANNTITFNQISNSFAATKAQQNAGASSDVFVSPATQQFHQSALGFKCTFDGTLTGTNAPLYGYNVTSVTRLSAGKYRINYTSPVVASAPVIPGVIDRSDGLSPYLPCITQTTANFCDITIRFANGTATNAEFVFAIGGVFS